MAKKNNTLTIISDADYSTWICDIATRYRQSQIRAAVRVNSELLHYYWTVGRDIHNRQFENRYGTAFYANASRDLRAELGVNEGFSETTLKYTKYFYELYAPLFPNRQQPADDFMATSSRNGSANLQHPVEQPAIGLIICKEKKTILARYALHGLTTPIGIADYQVTTQELPDDLRDYLPTHQELEHILTQTTPKVSDK